MIIQIKKQNLTKKFPEVWKLVSVFRKQVQSKIEEITVQAAYPSKLKPIVYGL